MKIEEKDEFKESINNPHDAAFKSAFKKQELARNFFENYLPKKILRHIDLDCLEIVDNSYVDEKLKEKYSDIVYKTRIKGKPAFLYIYSFRASEYAGQMDGFSCPVLHGQHLERSSRSGTKAEAVAGNHSTCSLSRQEKVDAGIEVFNDPGRE
jgi:hypothetical protein